jgi:putative acetyltransferase
MAVEVRRERPDDADAVRHVVATAFTGPVEAGLLDALRTDPERIDSGWVALVDELVVAQVTVVGVRVGGEPAHGLGIVSTLPDHQRAGHATRAIWAAVDHLIGCRSPLVVVLGSPTFYGRFGFLPAPAVGVDGGKYPAPFMQALPLRLGHPRGLVEYPAPYDDLPD